jgi:hypothetical protein
MVEGGPLYGVSPSADMPAEYNGEPILREVPIYILIIEMPGGESASFKLDEYRVPSDDSAQRKGKPIEEPVPPGQIIEEEGDIGG